MRKTLKSSAYDNVADIRTKRRMLQISSKAKNMQKQLFTPTPALLTAEEQGADTPSKKSPSKKSSAYDANGKRLREEQKNL